MLVYGCTMYGRMRQCWLSAAEFAAGAGGVYCFHSETPDHDDYHMLVFFGFLFVLAANHIATPSQHHQPANVWRTAITTGSKAAAMRR
ncbi:MAG: hypothetical protein ACLUOF_09090 [Ruminococcus sp.]